MYFLPKTLASLTFLLLTTPTLGAPLLVVSERSLDDLTIQGRDPAPLRFNWKFCSEHPESAQCIVKHGANPEKVLPDSARGPEPQGLEERMAASGLYKESLDRTLQEKPEICQQHPEYIICKMRIGTVVQKNSMISARDEVVEDLNTQISQEKRELRDLCQEHPKYSICKLERGGEEMPRKKLTSRNEDIEREYLQEKREERELCKQNPKLAFCRMRIGTTVHIPAKKIAVRNENTVERAESESPFCRRFPDSPACKKFDNLPHNKNHQS